MSRKCYTPEQIISILREAEVGLAQGEKVGPICRRLGISEQSYYRWRREYTGMKVIQARRLTTPTREFCASRPRVLLCHPSRFSRKSTLSRNSSIHLSRLLMFVVLASPRQVVQYLS